MPDNYNMDHVSHACQPYITPEVFQTILPIGHGVQTSAKPISKPVDCIIARPLHFHLQLVT